jgi:hypothetical protein
VLGRVLERLDHFLVGDLEVLGLGDRRHHGLALQLFLRVGFRLRDQLVARFPLHLQEHVGVHPLLRELAFHPLPAFGRSRGDDVVGDLDGRVVDRRVHRGDAEVFLGAAVQRAADFLADVATELLQRVELGGVGGEVVVELGKDFFPHLFDLDFEDRVLARQFLFLVLVREGDLDLDLVAGTGAGQLLLEVVDQLARAERQQIVVGLAAREGLVVDEALEVDQHRVALFGGALDRLEAREALSYPVDLRVDDLLVDLFVLFAYLEAFVLAELRLRPHADGELEGQRLALGLRGRLEVDVRVADRRDAGVQQRRFVPLRQRVADRFGQDGGEAHPLDHQVRRRFAFAEAGEAEFARHRAGGAVGGALDVLGGNLRLDLHT